VLFLLSSHTLHKAFQRQKNQSLATQHTTETGRVTRETVAVSNKREHFESRGLKAVI